MFMQLEAFEKKVRNLLTFYVFESAIWMLFEFQKNRYDSANSLLSILARIVGVAESLVLLEPPNLSEWPKSNKFHASYPIASFSFTHSTKTQQFLKQTSLSRFQALHHIIHANSLQGHFQCFQFHCQCPIDV
jgi:hypothetical protein